MKSKKNIAVHTYNCVYMVFQEHNKNPARPSLDTGIKLSLLGLLSHGPSCPVTQSARLG